MTLLGLKPLRFTQFLAVLREEQRVLPWWDRVKLILSLVRAVSGLGASRRLWRLRMRACHRCPIYDVQMKRCRPQTGHPFGCGCFMPFKAVQKSAKCWARENLDPAAGIGWPEDL